MKSQLSSLDMHFVLEELKELEGSKADRIYNSGKEEAYIQLHKSNVGKKVIRVIVGKAIFLADEKNADEAPSGFCMLLRKHLEGKFLDSIGQLEPERILELIFKAKDETRKLYLEFFGKGNIILCNEDGIIIDCLMHQAFKDRALAPKEKYRHPVMEYNLFDLREVNLVGLLKNSKKDKIVTCLAAELGLSGVYSEEACLLGGIDKNKAPKDITGNEIKKITDSIKKLIKNKKNPQIVYQGKEAIDAVPVDLELYKEYEKREFPGFNEALNEYFTKELKTAKKEESVYASKINEIKRIIAEQQETISSMEKKELENRQKGEMIYNNYQLIKEILDEINKAKEKYSWEEIKEKLKGHKIVKDVNLKDKMVVVEV